MFQLVTFLNQFADGLHVVFLLEVVETVKTVVDGVQFCGVEVDTLQLAADVLREVFQFDIAAVDALHIFRGGRQHPLDAPHG